MKVSIQIQTPTLGDMVIEESNDKTTTNKEDQRAIIVELLYEVLYKVQAAYRIPKEMLDIGDYTQASDRPISHSNQEEETEYSPEEIELALEFLQISKELHAR